MTFSVDNLPDRSVNAPERGKPPAEGSLGLRTLRSSLYHVFARLLAFPDDTLAEDLQSGEILRPLSDAVTALSLAGEDAPASALIDLVRRLGKTMQLMTEKDDLTNRYWESFESPLGRRVYLIESYYRTWTADPTSESPIAGRQGFLMSDHALHMQGLLALAGMTVPPGFEGRPDHLSLELEFMSLLCRDAAREAQAQFFGDHLTWVKEAGAAVEETAIDDLYLMVIRTLMSFLETERKGLGLSH
ncbi:MAG: molecular chaperone TorD family protein [Firmicutes bacterium]|nr:molecular chaperone TorD family protein [Bacillota bacterium]MCL5039844.1 molecular chaperone TorD family protein [Bacillota bacterium]